MCGDLTGDIYVFLATRSFLHQIRVIPFVEYKGSYEPSVILFSQVVL